MREILFKGKRVDNGKWVYGDFQLRSLQCFIVERGTLKIYKVIPESVSEFTGLTDKNETKIFEGDIVKAPIYYDVGCYPHTDVEIKVVKIPDVYWLQNDGDFEIIGNIHDNPELLKGGADNG